MKDCEANWVVVSAEFLCAMCFYGQYKKGKS